MPALSVIIADDHQLIRAGLSTLLETQTDLKVTAQCRTGRETLAALGSQPCHVLLLDLSLPDMSGLDVLKTARTRFPSVAVLVVSGFPERQFGINVLRTLERLRAAAAAEDIASLLAVPAGAPLLAVRRLALTYRERPVELRVSHVNTAHHEYENSFGKAEGLVA